ncbi:MAG: cysteine synthase family protein [Anaerolineaceae bacterium]|nr:cysteine synthase family protein [Anaerolineaceae bacterium]
MKTYTTHQHLNYLETVQWPIGQTPLLNLAATAAAAGLPDSVRLLAKAEWFNLSGSVKDRAARRIIQTAEAEGKLWPGMTLLDSSSGNMALSYASLGRLHGYKVKLFVPANATPARLTLLQNYSIDLTLTDPALGSDGAMAAARALAAQNPRYFYANQYDNPANWEAYYATLAPEVWQQTGGQVTHFVAGVGSGGTFTGAARWLKECNPAIFCATVQPQTEKEGIKGLKFMATAVPPKTYDPSLADAHLAVTAVEANATRQLLADCEGLSVGPSGGANVAAALQLGRTLDQGTIVTLFPDDSRYYS